ncbi:BTAD domain-containing putative transcriptional regulator [Oscillibacter sp.]|uniref:AfsR/SARP family transcriptional regulator n=1 Tax=Oscillibacter sp. TaxID=1945593 RepID=UPI0026071FD1|nr:BTAD domain-containing putative transcriptional regulator [Oscillibacter sp.]MDD3347751.1 BTAD domain-containing putative transcriptional regulator [Oscillibacter sp.]
METGNPRVLMLGEFSITLDNTSVTGSDNRSRKIWLLLAYMIYCRNRVVSQEDLVNLLWGEEGGSSNPLNALKTMFHRVRSMLNQLGNSVGQDLIIRKDGNYAWNTEIPTSLDVDDFEALCKAGSAAEEDAERLEKYREALALYQGDFLSKLSSEPWVVPIAAYFHNLYVSTALETLFLLEARHLSDEAVSLCRSAIAREPYNEALYQCLMRNLLATGDQRGVLTVYEDLSSLLLSDFGILPAEETRALYRDAVRIVNDRAVSIDTIQVQLQESEASQGALLCDYDSFRAIYHSEARAIVRSGRAAHIALLSLSGEAGQELPRRSLDRAMENLQDIVCINLRKGDIAARCSVSQFIVLLRQANYENSCKVCQRIVRSFSRQYPHSPAQLHHSVHALDPNV